MRIRPVVVTGVATLVAMSSVGIVIFSTIPNEAGATLVCLLWTAVFLVVWGLLCTALLVLRQSIVRSTWIALVLATVSVGVLLLLQRGML